MIFLPLFVKTTLSMNYVREVFLLFVFNASISYLLSYKRNIIFADQKNYIISLYTLIFTFISKVGQLGIFLLTKSYVLYLLVNIICTLLLNVIISMKADKLYPFLKNKIADKLPDDIKEMLISKIKALFLHSIGAYCVFGTDNILISYFLGVSEVGRYSSYVMIFSFIVTLFNQLYNGISSSVGNFIVLKNKEEQYNLYRKIEIINSLIVIFFEVCLATLINPFISWWLGSDAVFPMQVVYLMVISNFITLSRNPILNIKSSAGLFEPDKFAPLIESLVNLIVSCFLAYYIGLRGIIAGTIISSLVVPFWVSPKIVYKYLFKKNFITYFMTPIRNCFFIACIIFLIYLTNKIIIIDNNTISLIIHILISFLICVVSEILIFSRNKYIREFLYDIKMKIKIKNSSIES